MQQLIVGAVQVSCGDDLDADLSKIEGHVRAAAKRGATLVVLQELIDGCYFCKDSEADRVSECVITAAIDMAAAQEWRRAWGVFRDRRPDLYGRLLEQASGELLPPAN